MATIVTYDVPTKHVELKKTLFQLGYKDQIPDSTCKIIYLPNTTLYHETKTSEQVRNDVKNACTVLHIELERCIATAWTNWAAMCGKPFN